MSAGIWIRDAKCVATEVDGTLVLLDLETGTYFALNGPAADVWQMLDERRDEPALVDMLVTKYEVEPEHCARSVSTILSDFVNRGLVKPAS